MKAASDASARGENENGKTVVEWSLPRAPWDTGQGGGEPQGKGGGMAAGRWVEEVGGGREGKAGSAVTNGGDRKSLELERGQKKEGVQTLIK